jgi:hypothetical protein
METLCSSSWEIGFLDLFYDKFLPKEVIEMHSDTKRKVKEELHVDATDSAILTCFERLAGI